MTEEERRIDDLKKYKDWEKTQRKFIVSFDGISPQSDGTCFLSIRNDENVINVGDCFGGAFILKISAYGKELDFLSPGTTGAIVLDTIPIFNVLETIPEFSDWLKEVRNKKITCNF